MGRYQVRLQDIRTAVARQRATLVTIADMADAAPDALQRRLGKVDARDWLTRASQAQERYKAALDDLA